MFSVHGKRRKLLTTSDDAQARRAKRGRPMKRATALSIPKDVKNARLRSLHVQAQITMAAPETSVNALEQLPNELIQQIFFHCFETNLPRASPRLAQALSFDSVYNALILFAYFDDDNDYPVDTKVFLPAIYTPLELAERVRIQESILSCRWCTLDRIQACLPNLSRLSMTQAWYEELKTQERLVIDASGGTLTDLALTVRDVGLEDRASLPRLEDPDDMVRHFFAKEELRCVWSYGEDPGMLDAKISPFEQYLPRIVTWRLVLEPSTADGELRIRKNPDGRKSVLAARVLPDYIVRGSPWTQGKLELLQLLRQGFRSIQRDFVLEISATAIFEGMSSAITEKNTTALVTLLELHNDVFGEERLAGDSVSVIPRTSHPLPTYLFHLATRAGTKSSAIMWLMIRGGMASIPKDDTMLTAWALKGQAKGDQVAKWLLDHMSGVADCRPGPGGIMFVHGQTIGFGSEGTSPPPDRSFAEELEYLEVSKFHGPRPLTNIRGDSCG